MLGAQLVTLYTSLPARTTMVMFTGHPDPRRMASLGARKVAFESAIKIGKKVEEMDRSEWWTASDVRALEEDVWKGKRGSLFFGGQADLSVRIVCADAMLSSRRRLRCWTERWTEVRLSD